tara:strand:+ start:885 stop:2138 length:1254 start_codon:yes stop_codon:yes gene_type:complete
MRSFSWEIFVGAILLFFVAILVSNEKEAKERREAGLDGTKNIFSGTQNLESKIQQKAREIEQKIKENTTGRLSQSQALQTIPNQSITGTQDSPSMSEARLGQWIESSPGIYTFSSVLSLNNKESLSIDIPFGSLEFSSEASGSKGKPLLILTASGKIQDANWLQNQLSIIDSSTNSGVRVFMSKSGNKTSNFQLQARLIIPEETNVNAKTQSGHIELSNIAGKHSLNTKGGHVEVVDVKGSLEVTSGGGHIDVLDMEGDLELFTKGGHITLENVSGNIKATTNGGYIDLDELEGSLWALTKGGNITVSIAHAGERVTLITEAGNIRLSSSETKPYFCTMNANAGINFGNSAIVGNLFGSFTGFLFPQEKLDDYASDLQNLFNTMDLSAFENPTYGSFGVLPLVNLSAELGTITTEFE